MSRPDKRETLFQYDSFKREISQKSPFYEHQESTFDVAGRLVNRKFKDEKGSQENQFTYDFLHHLTSEKGDTNHTYTCDSLHNRLSKNDVSYQSNGLHQLIHQGNCDYQYDQNGNLIVKQEAEEKTSYTYDAFNRLTQVCVKDQIIHYKYDAFHRRIAKILPDQIIRYLYAGQDEIGSVNEKGEIQELRILGLGKGAEIGASVALEFNHQVYIPTHDFSGNIVHLSTLEGKSLETYRYTSFGECQIFAKGKELVASSVANPWRFCSKRLDPETGLLFFGRRFYDPTTARWITTDPSGFVDGPNLYAYLHHHPLHKYDLYGLQEENAQEQTYPLENVDFHDKDTPAQEDCNPNEAPLGFVKSEAKKSKFYYCGFNQVLEMGIGFMHGIMNDIYDAYKSAKTLSTLLDDHFVLHVDNSSRGFVYDIARSFFELVFHVQTKSVKAQQKAWDAFLLNSKGLYLHFCHSEGAIITRNAIETYPEELRQRIIIVAIAPAGYIDDKYAYSVIHYRSTRDIVPLLDVTGAIRCRHSTVVLEPHKDAPLFDHSFDSPTYSKVKEYHINEYKKLCANNGVL
jgi:RHS repeat-associated protein